MSGAHPGAHEPVSILYKYPHILAEKSYLPLEVIGEASRRRRRNRNLSRLLETLVSVSTDSALVSASFGVGYQKIKILCCEIGKLK